MTQAIIRVIIGITYSRYFVMVLLEDCWMLSQCCKAQIVLCRRDLFYKPVLRILIPKKSRKMWQMELQTNDKWTENVVNRYMVILVL